MNFVGRFTDETSPTDGLVQGPVDATPTKTSCPTCTGDGGDNQDTKQADEMWDYKDRLYQINPNGGMVIAPGGRDSIPLGPGQTVSPVPMVPQSQWNLPIIPSG